MLTFNAIDVETANADSGSICQIGITHVVDGEIAEVWSTLVNPEASFDRMNVRLHRIAAKTVVDSPTIPALSGELRRRLDGAFLVSHTAFDRVAMDRAMDRYGLPSLEVTWLDSARIAKAAWPRLRSTSLSSMAKKLRIQFRHHDAGDDSMVSARIVLRASELTGKSLQDWAHELV